MKLPYDITAEILNQIVSVSEKLGEINSYRLSRPAPKLRRENRIRSVHSSLAIEGNTLSIDQVSDVFDEKTVTAPHKDILEVRNAIDLYARIGEFDPFSISSFKKAHSVLMKDLTDAPGEFRTGSVGVVKGKEIAHLAPPGDRVAFLMKDLFSYIKNDKDAVLIKSCVFHYETEFIHPFTDGNGRMGRFWQTALLRSSYPVFEFLPVESIIKEKQQQYYNVLSFCDKTGKSTKFIEFMLMIIDSELGKILLTGTKILSSNDRLAEAKEKFGIEEFSRKDYIRLFKDISTATASRDLKSGVLSGNLVKTGEKRLSVYKFK